MGHSEQSPYSECCLTSLGSIGPISSLNLCTLVLLIQPQIGFGFVLFLLYLLFLLKLHLLQIHRYREQTSGYQWGEGRREEQYIGRGEKEYYGIL